MFKYRKVPKHWKYLLTQDYQICLKDTPVKPGLVQTDFILLLRVADKKEWLKIKNAYAWDGPSGPAIDTKSFMRGSLVHDALYQLMREKHLDRKLWRPYVDKLLRKICLEDGMSKFRAWYVYHGVRLFAASSTKKR